MSLDLNRSFIEQTAAWPSIIVPFDMVREMSKTYRPPEDARHELHMKLCQQASVPYGKYVTIDKELRVETEEMKARVLDVLASGWQVPA